MTHSSVDTSPRPAANAGRGADPGTGPGASLRIAFLAAEDKRTGTYFRYHNLARALIARGHAVTVYSQTSQSRLRSVREERDGVPYLLAPTVPGNRWLMSPVHPGNVLRRMSALIGSADVYHLFQSFPSAALPWLALRRKRKGLFAHDWDDFWINEEFGLKHPRGLNARWSAYCLKRLEAMLPARSALLTSVSQKLADLGAQRGAARTLVLHNGVWNLRATAQPAARRRLGLREDAIYVGLIGWSGEASWCLKALRHMAARIPELRLVITGKDPSCSLGAYSDIRDRVDYLGVVSDSELGDLHGSLDLGLVPLAETEFNQYRLPYKLTDHLGAGVPVLCSDLGEAAVIGRRFAGATLCPPSLDGWLSAFEGLTLRLKAGVPPPQPDTEIIQRELSWVRQADLLAAAYRECLART